MSHYYDLKRRNSLEVGKKIWLNISEQCMITRWYETPRFVVHPFIILLRLLLLLL